LKEHTNQGLKGLFHMHYRDYAPRASHSSNYLSLVPVMWVVFALPLSASAQSSLTDLGVLLPGALSSSAYGVSSDGTVVVGSSHFFSQEAFRWTQAGGMVGLGTLNGGSNSIATGVSADGAVVVGIADNGAWDRAFRWTQAGGMVSLGTINGGRSSEARGVSADGAVVVGIATDGAAGNQDRAFRWTQAGGMVSLGTLNGGNSSQANGVSGDGAVVVGTAGDGAAGGVARAFRWTQAGGMVSLSTLNGGNFSWGNGASGDGAVVVGTANDGAAGNQARAFRWTQAGGMASLGTLNGGNFSWGYGVSGDGAVVVGAAGDGAAGGVTRAFRWTQATGLEKVEDWLRNAGVTVPVDVTIMARATNADGSVVVGTLDNNQAFIARVAAVGSGLITLTDVQESLSGTARGSDMTLTSTSTLINGAHSRPLVRRVGANRNAFWLAGDWGMDNHGDRSGDLGLAEVGLGHNFGTAQVNVSIGQTWAKQNQTLNGNTQTEGTYLWAEALFPVSGNFWAVLGGYVSRGEADMRRGYLNAGVQDYSRGTPDLNTWAMRARFEWVAAWRAAETDFSPYADMSYTEARLAAYTETGGGFPARFDARKEKASELRFGVNATRPMASGLDLVATLEAAHRFERNGTASSGEVIGLFPFSLDGRKNQRNWLRAGIGVEGVLAEGKASLMFNATTKGEAASAWLAANWQRTF
jgi:probable HAF family extracellular repeat protein